MQDRRQPMRGDYHSHLKNRPMMKLSIGVTSVLMSVPGLWFLDDTLRSLNQSDPFRSAHLKKAAPIPQSQTLVLAGSSLKLKSDRRRFRASRTA